MSLFYSSLSLSLSSFTTLLYMFENIFNNILFLYFLLFREYTKIENDEQRRQYKADFNKDYREYQILHQKVERVSQHFEQLEKRLRQEKEGSDAFQVTTTPLFLLIVSVIFIHLFYCHILFHVYRGSRIKLFRHILPTRKMKT